MNLIFRRLSIFLHLVFLWGCMSSPETDDPSGSAASLKGNLPKDTLRIFCPQDQHQLTCQWMKDFQKDHTRIHTEVLLYDGNMPLNSGIINKANPNCQEIMESGLGIRPFTCLQAGEKTRTWMKAPYICPVPPSRCRLLADHLKIDLNEFRIILTATVQDMIDSVK